MEGTRYAAGSLVKVRGREWIVLPQTEEDWLELRPIGGSEAENAAVYLPLEPVEPAEFSLPDTSRPGDNHSAGLLRQAIRLGFRSSAGPFRSAAHLGFEPRPYQLVPLLMALKRETVRILIADDVGIGKTIEAGLIARELLDRGEIQRLAVLCPPPLAEQWQQELREKFHIEAVTVLASTAAKLEREITPGQSIFEAHPFVIVSLDYIKSERRRDEFLRVCPEFVIVDEAHSCAAGSGKAAQQRHALVRALAAKPERHLVLVTATPHSGKEDAFRSLISLLNPEFAELPEDLTKAENQQLRRSLAAYFVQRRRADVRAYMKEETPFPEREESERSYTLSPEYAALFQKVLGYARELIRDREGSSWHQRVRWWSALALLRSIASSPAAAAETLRSRALGADTEESDPEELNRAGRRSVLDFMDLESLEGGDSPLGAEFTPEGSPAGARLRKLAAEAESLMGAKDRKLQSILPEVKQLLKEGYNPILFCRFIPTAEYLAEALRNALPKDVNVIAVSGTLPPAERVARIEALRESPRRVLVATDCLSEGINLQELFSAVIHYDLSWNPTRHEQREGRVDRYGQSAEKVRVLTYFGKDNKIDGLVLNVLLRKHKAIRNSLGISVPIPANAEQAVEAILEGLMLSDRYDSAEQGYLPGLEPKEKTIMMREWDNATAREKQSRTIFAQNSIHPETVAEELRQTREAIGAGVELPRFCADALKLNGAAVRCPDSETLTVRNTGLPGRLRDGLRCALGGAELPETQEFRFCLPLKDGQRLLSRTHPWVEALANDVLEGALDSAGAGEGPRAARCGVVKTAAVQTRTTLLLLRFRYTIRGAKDESPMLAEECLPAAFTGRPGRESWLSEAEADRLLQVVPSGTPLPEQIQQSLRLVTEGMAQLTPHLQELALERAAVLETAHNRVRAGRRAAVTPRPLPDILGFYVYLP